MTSTTEQRDCAARLPADDIAVVLGGGGARAAYQVGFLRCLARHMPQFRFPIVTGVSAGAINATFLAAHSGSLREAADHLSRLWSDLTVNQVFRVDSGSLLRSMLRWGIRLLSGGSAVAPRVRGMVDTQPLYSLLHRTLRADGGEVWQIAENLDKGLLRAVALTTLNYSTGQTVTWVQGCDIQTWERPDRRSFKTRIKVEHVMASAALPLLFPAVRLGTGWCGDGGIRLVAPLAPALHLGATRILAISTRYHRSQEEANAHAVQGYPPPAQVMGNLLNAIFLDLLDQDALRLERLNSLLRKLPESEWGDLKLVKLLVLRPSRDLGRLAGEYEPRLPRSFRFLTRSLGTRETASPDFLSLLMFQPEYLRRLMEIGEADAEAQLDQIVELLGEAEPVAAS